MAEEIQAALCRLVVEHLATVAPTEWWPWVRALPTVEFKDLMLTILRAGAGEYEDRILDLLGTTAGDMTQEELQTWAPAILLTRNRMLASRKDLPPDTTPP